LQPKVPFFVWDAHVAERELDLFKLPAGLVTETRACATKIVRSHILQTTFRTPGHGGGLKVRRVASGCDYSISGRKPTYRS